MYVIPGSNKGVLFVEQYCLMVINHLDRRLICGMVCHSFGEMIILALSIVKVRMR
jgi:hypothetical protein